MKNLPKDLIQYHFTAMEAFYTFLKDENVSDLTNRLIRIENHYRRINELPNDARGIWFRFFNGDTLATSICDIVHTIVSGTNENKTNLHNSMEACCNLAEIEIYYS